MKKNLLAVSTGDILDGKMKKNKNKNISNGESESESENENENETKNKKSLKDDDILTSKEIGAKKKNNNNKSSSSKLNDNSDSENDDKKFSRKYIEEFENDEDSYVASVGSVSDVEEYYEETDSRDSKKNDSKKKIEEQESKKESKKESKQDSNKESKKESKNNTQKSLCEWITIKGRCKKIVNNTFCERHSIIIQQFKQFKPNKDNDVQCSSIKDIKLTPRSKDHVLHIMKRLNIHEKYIDVLIKNNTYTEETLEEADFSNEDYIEITSDRTKFYYKSNRGKYKASDLKIYFKKYCQNECVVTVNGINYCTSCYNHMVVRSDYPLLHIIV